MSVEMAFVLILVAVSVLLFATEKLPVDLTALFVMVVLMAAGIISPADGLAGLSNPATVTVAAMFVLSAGLFNTGALNYFGAALAKMGRRSYWKTITLIMLAASVFSAFVNNTAVVAILMPILLGVARDTNTSPRQYLIPLSFASMFGGVCTLIGTSTNILVDSIAQAHGLAPFGLFEFAWLGIVFLVCGLAYMLTVGIRLLPAGRGMEDLTQKFRMADYLTEIVLLPHAKSIGKSLQNAPLLKEIDIDVLGIYRKGRRLAVPSPRTRLKEGDILRVRCDIERLKHLQAREGIALQPEHKWQDTDLQSDQAMLVETVIAPNSELEGKSLVQARFRNTIGGTVLAIRHHGELVHEKLGTTRLRAGDALLVKIRKEDYEELLKNPQFVIVSEIRMPIFKKRRIVPALIVIAGVVATAALKILPIVVSASTGAVLLILVGCIKLEEVYRVVDWRVVFLLAGVLALGVALERTGAAAYLADSLVQTAGKYGPAILLSALFLTTMLLTNMISNAATAALLAPIAISTAATMGVSPKPFLMAVTFAASLSFMTPVGYQTNVLIYGPGQYRFADFMRVGTPLTLVFWIIGSLLIPVIWPFSP